MLNTALARLTTVYLTRRPGGLGPSDHDDDHERHGADPATEDGFEIAQSMGIALLGLVVAAAFATALQSLGVDVIDRIRAELGL